MVIDIDKQAISLPISEDDIIETVSRAAAEFYGEFLNFPNRRSLKKPIGETSFNVLTTQTEKYSARSVVKNLVVEINPKQQSSIIGVYLNTPLSYG